MCYLMRTRPLLMVGTMSRKNKRGVLTFKEVLIYRLLAGVFLVLRQGIVRRVGGNSIGFLEEILWRDVYCWLNIISIFESGESVWAGWPSHGPWEFPPWAVS